MSQSPSIIFLGCSDNEKLCDLDIFLSCLLFYILAKKLKITGSLGDFKVSLVRAIFVRKSARRCTCALGRARRCFRYKDKEHSLNSEHECTLLRLPRTLVSKVIVP
jgi:hypothetical protein